MFDVRRNYTGLPFLPKTDSCSNSAAKYNESRLKARFLSREVTQKKVGWMKNVLRWVVKRLLFSLFTKPCFPH